MKKGKVDGRSVSFSENGTIVYESNFKEDVQEGLQKEYNKDGTLKREYALKGGLKHGEDKYFFGQNFLSHITLYNEGIPIQVKKTWGKDDSLYAVKINSKGEYEGKWKHTKDGSDLKIESKFDQETFNVVIDWILATIDKTHLKESGD